MICGLSWAEYLYAREALCEEEGERLRAIEEELWREAAASSVA